MKLLFTLFTIVFSAILNAQQTKSPYLETTTKEANIPLKATQTSVQISGTIANVQIIQTYKNLTKTAIEASYIFPMSTKAAVHDMNITTGNRTTKAIVFEKKKANKIYNKAIKEGKRAAKLDQERPNVFKMKVGNILPNEEVIISLSYTEMLINNADEYQFIIPGVVGPRFTGEKKSKEEVFNVPYTKKGTNNTFTNSIDVCINAGVIIKNIFSKSHKIDIHYPDATSAEIVVLDENSANRDFILNYSLRGTKIESGLLLYEGENENFFTLMVQPPKEIVSKKIPPREYLFIVDVSGSMNGYPLDVSKELMRNLLSDLKETDTFNVQLFASTSSIFKEKSVNATSTNIETAINYLNKSTSNYGGGTELINALKTAYKLPRKDENSARTMVLITDGYINVEKETFELIENNLDKANVFTFGIGSSVNRYLIEGISKVSNSNSFVATSKTDALKVAKDFKKMIAHPVLTQIKLTTNNFDIYDVTPKTIPDVFANRPLLIYGKYKGKANGTISFSGWQGDKKITQTHQVQNGKLSKDNKALKYLWARKKIEQLIDYKRNFNEDVKQEVIKLGLTYNLATEFTSFVAIDNEIVNKKGKLTNVKQPLTMPKYVNNTSVGAAADIKGTSKIKKTFKITISNNINNNQKRAIKMWLKGNYSAIINMYLNKYKNIKLHINKNGQIVKIEKEENGLWKIISNLKVAFNQLPTNLNTNQNTVIILTK
ncbi:VIT and vWA domain-containing protein [Polaribacter sargassicola]|uniref:VIT and vWA domain-containing protein n=1 Tax=Polaribacter sargassicola TaxID=2836891 RepID=UPI001F3DA4C6|nr:VIT and VWA domain-containing protein [Polaribacter sp. DS7-9]MCG1036898.1 VWA domain-containing protein [Polaribacter sp. DS7-9]